MHIRTLHMELSPNPREHIEDRLGSLPGRLWTRMKFSGGTCVAILAGMLDIRDMASDVAESLGAPAGGLIVLAPGARRIRWMAPGRFAAAILLCVTAGCERGPRNEDVKQSREVMGTFAELTAVASDTSVAHVAVEAGYGRLDDVNRLMSDYIAESEIGRLNRLPAGESMSVSPETLFCLRRSLEVSAASGGAFDVTCRPLVRLWKAAGKRGALPSASELEAARARVGWRKLGLDPEAGAVTLSAENMQIDLGGIAKGYALDLAAEAMKRAGAVGGLVNVGGDMVAFGKRADGRAWTIGVKDPFNPGSLVGRLRVENRAVATSGLQQRFVEIGGRRYSHIIDPRSGQPVDESPCVTVIAPTGLAADAWATVFSVLSPAEGHALIEEKLVDAGVEAMWISGNANEPKIERTAGFGAFLIGP